MSLALGTTLGALALGAVPALASTAPGAPSVTMSPAPNYHDGQVVTVSFGANALFASKGDISIRFLECADPGGLAANLPTNQAQCDATTYASANTATDGSDSVQFTMYTLPNAALGEAADGVPVCNATTYCVLYAGENYLNFNEPHVFSAPFLIGATNDPPVSGAAATSTTTAGTGSSSTSTTKPKASSTTTSTATKAAGATTVTSTTTAASTSTATLASTGTASWVYWVLGLGIALLLASTAGITVVRRRSARTTQP